MGHIINPIYGSSDTNEPLSVDPGLTVERYFNHPNDAGRLDIETGDDVYIHIAGSSDSGTSSIVYNNPEISLKLYPLAGGTPGDQINLSPASSSGWLYYRSPSSSSSLVGKATLTTIGKNVHQIRIPSIGNHNGIGQWRIQFTNTTGKKMRIIWVLADSTDEASQPWLHVPEPSFELKSIRKGERHSDPQKLTIVNRGTGDLEISGPSSNGGFDLETPLPIKANSWEEMTVKLNENAKEPGEYEEEFDLESNDKWARSNTKTSHNKQVKLFFIRLQKPTESDALQPPTLSIVSE